MSSHLIGRPPSMLKDVKGKGKGREETAHLASLTGGTDPAVVTSPKPTKAPAGRRLPRARKAAITMVSPLPVQALDLGRVELNVARQSEKESELKLTDPCVRLCSLVHLLSASDPLCHRAPA